MRFCPECGATLFTQKFCQECGADISKYLNASANTIDNNHEKSIGFDFSSLEKIAKEQLEEQQKIAKIKEEEIKAKAEEERKRKDEEEKVAERKRRCEAAIKKGDDHYYGKNGKNKNYLEAMIAYGVASNIGSSYAQYMLAWCYDHAQGTERDESLAISWYKKSAKQGYEPSKKELKKKWQVGMEIAFGSYGSPARPVKWILYRFSDKGNAFLICKDILDHKPFHINDQACTFETSAIRKWLNSTFYDQCFSESEKKHLLWHGVGTISDKVSLPTQFDVDKYFGAYPGIMQANDEWWLQNTDEDGTGIFMAQKGTNCFSMAMINDMPVGVRPVILVDNIFDWKS